MSTIVPASKAILERAGAWHLVAPHACEFSTMQVRPHMCAATWGYVHVFSTMQVRPHMCAASWGYMHVFKLQSI